jgi:formylglycine-generating enzyme required for sulfatase activity
MPPQLREVLSAKGRKGKVSKGAYGRRKEKIEAVVARAGRWAPRPWPPPAMFETRAMFAAALGTFGRMDMLFNNAGVSPGLSVRPRRPPLARGAWPVALCEIEKVRLGGRSMVRAAVRIFVSLTVLAFAGHAACAGKRVALVIGNSAYALAPLENPRNDADDIAAALKRLGFEVMERKDLDVRGFDRALDSFIPQAQGADVALFFFSGHGVQIDKRGFLAPIDVKAESESSALRQLIAIQEVVARIENAAKVSVIVLDACRDSSLQERIRRVALERNKGLVPEKGLPPPPVVGSNTLVVYATVPGETASDGRGRNSPFTTALLANMETPGLEIELMFKRVTADVLSATGGKQQPERLSRLQHELVLQPAASAEDVARLQERLSQLQTELQQKQQVAVVAPPNSVPSAAQPADAACEDGLLVLVAMGKKPCIKPGSGESFRDCPDCPEMVIVPAGGFNMGSPKSEPERSDVEGPQHHVRIAKPFAVGRFPVTFAEWDACVDDGRCGRSSDIAHDGHFGRGDRPVINVSWNDAKAYVQWLSNKTGKAYRLLSEAEREYVARAGTTTPFWWGSTITPEQANYRGNMLIYEGGGQKGEYREKTLPVKSFKPNPWGLYQVHGNVWEWVEDCRHDTYNGAPTDGSAWLGGDCTEHRLRGGSWDEVPWKLRAAYRFFYQPNFRHVTIGFRVAQDLNR